MATTTPRVLTPRIEVERMARDLMKLHGLSHLPFKWSRSKRRIGGAHWRRNHTTNRFDAAHLSLSEYVVPYLAPEQVEDVILHEIAHFLAGYAAHHGPAWRRMARKVGANPERTTDIDPAIRAKNAKWAMECQACGHEVHFYRRPKSGGTYRHKGCGGTFGPLHAKR